ncbi:MAG: tetratricopeptide repeat-containing sulfotransferase family protein [Steroidobacteraceae bacterium]
MLLNWFDTRAVTELGGTLADHLIAEAASTGQRKKSGAADQKAIQAFLKQVDREAPPLRLNLVKRAKLANSFKWRLLDKGIEPAKVDELTQLLLLRISANDVGATQAASTAANAAKPKRTNAGQIETLLFKAIESASRGSHREAIDLYQKLLELDPLHALARNNLAAILIKLGRLPQADQELRRALEIKRDYPDALCNLATILRTQGYIPEAETRLRRALKLSPQHIDAQIGLGLTLVLARRLREAQECFQRALKLTPRNADAWIGSAEIAESQGRFDDAQRMLVRALEIEPRSPIAWALQPRLRRMTRNDDAWLQSAESIAEDNLGPVEEATLRFAIGKYYDDVADYSSAFRSYQRANELQKTTAHTYDRHERTQFVDDLKRVFTRHALANAGTGPSDSERPVFVVGMMRSGTSLVEQIIASHPCAAGAGELDFWVNCMRKHEIAIRHELPHTQLRRLWAHAYLQALKTHSRDAVRVVDKSNFNSDYLGLIHLVFPKARFIYVDRDPFDTCLSCYFQQFSSALNFSLDLSDLAHYYRHHRRLIDHWRAALPSGRLLEIPYEELVVEQEKWTRQILDFLGLPWDERCLRFHETDRTVLTASAWQVRQRLYLSSVARWRHYEKFISPLRELAEPG